jgi:hypothetical protein
MSALLLSVSVSRQSSSVAWLPPEAAGRPSPQAAAPQAATSVLALLAAPSGVAGAGAADSVPKMGRRRRPAAGPEAGRAAASFCDSLMMRDKRPLAAASSDEGREPSRGSLWSGGSTALSGHSNPIDDDPMTCSQALQRSRGAATLDSTV